MDLTVGVDTAFLAYLLVQPETGVIVFIASFVVGLFVVALLGGLTK